MADLPPYVRTFSFTGYQANKPADPVPGLQIDKELDDIAVRLRLTGKTAYEIAVLNGFSGSIGDWLLSLVGPKGSSGAPGAAGAPGKVQSINGKSATDVVLSASDVGAATKLAPLLTDFPSNQAAKTAPVVIVPGGNQSIADVSGVNLCQPDTVLTTGYLNAGGAVRSFTAGGSGKVWYDGRGVGGVWASGADALNFCNAPTAFMRDVRHDAAQIASGEFLRGAWDRMIVDGATTGSRVAHLATLQMDARPSNPQGSNFQGGARQAIINSGVGILGTGTTKATAAGAFFADNAYVAVQSGVRNALEFCAMEFDLETQTNTSAAAMRVISLVDMGATQGDVLDCMLSFSGSSEGGYGPGIGRKVSILFTDFNGGESTNGTTKLLSTYWTDGVRRTIAAGFDLSGFVVTGPIIQGASSYLTEDTLALGANGVNISTIIGGNNKTNANLLIRPTGGGGVLLRGGTSGTTRVAVDDTGVGFYGHATVAQQARPADLAGVITVLANLGLTA